MAEIRLSGNKAPLFTLPDIEIDEFVPVVQIDSARLKSEMIVAALKGSKVELSPLMDAPLRAVELDIVVVVPGKILVTCTVAKGREGSLDYDGIVTPRLVGKVQGVTVEAAEKGKVRYGDPYEFTLEIVGSAERVFRIEFYANDDDQDANVGEFEDILCGCIEVRTWPDVFSESDVDRLVDEMEFIAPFNSAGEPDEYAINYCMHAAERGISRLMGNNVDFYSVDRSHRRENEVSLEGNRAGLRGDHFMRSGFVKAKIEADEYSVNRKVVSATRNEADYKANKYAAVSLPPGSKLARELRKSFEGKPGLHVYYVSVSDDYHTLLLIVDSRGTRGRSYAIYDQDGRTSSFGPLVDIETGFERQTSWTFLHFFMEKGFDANKTCGTLTRTWKIQRKH